MNVENTAKASRQAMGASGTLNFRLYSRSYCHLCQEMHEALEQLLRADGQMAAIEVIDVDAAPELLALYDELVPVLTWVNEDAEIQLCHYFLDQTVLHELLAGRALKVIEADDGVIHG